MEQRTESIFVIGSPEKRLHWRMNRKRLKMDGRSSSSLGEKCRWVKWTDREPSSSLKTPPNERWVKTFTGNSTSQISIVDKEKTLGKLAKKKIKRPAAVKANNWEEHTIASIIYIEWMQRKASLFRRNASIQRRRPALVDPRRRPMPFVPSYASVELGVYRGEVRRVFRVG